MLAERLLFLSEQYVMNEHVYAHQALFEESRSHDETNHFSKKPARMRENEAYIQITRASS